MNHWLTTQFFHSLIGTNANFKYMCQIHLLFYIKNMWCIHTVENAFPLLKYPSLFGHSSSSLYPQHTSQWARQIVTCIRVFKLQNYMKQNFCFTTTFAFYMSKGLSLCDVIWMQNALKAPVFEHSVTKLVANYLWRLSNF